MQHEAKIKLKTGVKRDGTLIAVEAYCYYNSGAYADTHAQLDHARIRGHRTVSCS